MPELFLFTIPARRRGSDESGRMRAHNARGMDVFHRVPRGRIGYDPEGVILIVALATMSVEII
jgi:hypothetical protein